MKKERVLEYVLRNTIKRENLPVRKGRILGNIFGIALVFVVIGTLVRGLRGTLNAGAADDSSSPNETPGVEICTEKRKGNRFNNGSSLRK